jgi:hypothetical protein
MLDVMTNSNWVPFMNRSNTSLFKARNYNHSATQPVVVLGLTVCSGYGSLSRDFIRENEKFSDFFYIFQRKHLCLVQIYF